MQHRLLGWGIVSGVKLVDDLDRGRGADARCAAWIMARAVWRLDAARRLMILQGGGLGHQANMLGPCAARPGEPVLVLIKSMARRPWAMPQTNGFLIGQGCRSMMTFNTTGGLHFLADPPNRGNSWLRYFASLSGWRPGWRRKSTCSAPSLITASV